MTNETLERAKRIEKEIQDYENMVYSLNGNRMHICKKSKKNKDGYRLCSLFYDNSIWRVLPQACNFVIIKYLQNHIEELRKELKEL